MTDPPLLLPDLITRCLHGSASCEEWKILDRAIVNDPAIARRWVQETQLHHDLYVAFGTAPAAPQRAARFALALLCGGIAAAIVVFSFTLWRMPEPSVLSTGSPAGQSVPPPPPATETVAAKPEARPLSVSSVSVTEKVIALTLEDGPVAANTPRLLDMLKAADVKATFFPIGFNLERHPEILRRMKEEGHDIGNHTQTHGLASKQSDDKLREEIRRPQQKITEVTGKAPTFWRPPYGGVTPRQVQLVADEFGLTTILWSVDPQDWKHRNTALTIERVIAGVQPGGIVLLHDIHAFSVDAVPEILRRLKADGWTFVTVTQLLAMPSAPAAKTDE